VTASLGPELTIAQARGGLESLARRLKTMYYAGLPRWALGICPLTGRSGSRQSAGRRHRGCRGRSGAARRMCECREPVAGAPDTGVASSREIGIASRWRRSSCRDQEGRCWRRAHRRWRDPGG